MALWTAVVQPPRWALGVHDHIGKSGTHVVQPPRWLLDGHDHIGKSGTHRAAANVAIAMKRPNWTPSCAATKIGRTVFLSKNRVPKNRFLKRDNKGGGNNNEVESVARRFTRVSGGLCSRYTVKHNRFSLGQGPGCSTIIYIYRNNNIQQQQLLMIRGHRVFQVRDYIPSSACTPFRGKRVST